MNCAAADHFSHKYELPLGKIPTKSSDRISLGILLPGLLFSFLMVCLGVYDLFYGGAEANALFEEFAALEDSSGNYHSFISPVFFDAVVILLGLGSIISLIFSYIRYKKIFFDGKKIKIIYRSALGKKASVLAPLADYEGVRFRIAFLQCGVVSRNKYIIELYHKDPEKIAPLYISTSGKNIREIWENYAKKLKKPGMINTDEGEVVRSFKDVDKSLRKQYNAGLIADDYDFYAPLPENISYVRKRDKVVIKGHKIVWDAYNFLAWFFIFVYSAAYLSVLFQLPVVLENFGAWKTAGLFAGGFAVLLASIWLLFRKEKLVIKKRKIVHTYKYMLFSTKHDEMDKDDIEAVDIMVNPVSGRRCLSISSAKKTIAFGKKLPLKDLQWVKKMLVHEVVS